MSTQQLHVVLGAGPAGRTLAGRLAADGAAVRIVSRNTVDLGPAVESRSADLMDPEQAVAVTEGAVVIHHCVNVPYQQQVGSMPRLARSITDAAARHGARLVVLDTLYPYGESDGEAITEATPWAATSRKGRMRAELDRYYLTRHEAGDVRVVLGRSADFFGPEVLNSTLGGAFFPGALTGEPVLAFGDIELPHSYTFMPDVAAGMALLGEADDDALGRVWHLPTVPAVSTASVHGTVAELTGRPLEVTVLPEARPYGPFDAAFMAEYEEMFYQHLIPQNMISEAFESRFGTAPTPLRQALALTLDWYADRVQAGDGHG